MRLHFLDGKLPLPLLFLTPAVLRFLPVAGEQLGLFVGRVECLQLLAGRKHRVGLALLYKLLGVHPVNRAAQALPVGAVGPAVADRAVLSEHSAFVKADAVSCQRADQAFGRSGHLALGVGVLYPQIKHAAALVRQPLPDGGGKQPAKVHKAGGAWRKAGDLGSLRQAARGICLLQLRGRFRSPRGRADRQAVRSSWVGFLPFRQLFTESNASPSIADGP